MDTVHTTLRRIRFWFLIWFIAESAAGTAAAAYVLEGMGNHSLFRYGLHGLGAAGTALAGIGVSVVLLLPAWLVLNALLELRPWARLVMLVIGWITVVSAAINLVTLPASSVLLAAVVRPRGGHWETLMALSALTKVADLAFWSWVVYVLQVNPAVREAFLCHRPFPAGTTST